MAMLEMLRAAVPLLVRVALCAALVVPTVCELKVRLVSERLTAGVGVGGGVLPPPPQAAQTPTTTSAVANSQPSARRRTAAKLKNVTRASSPAKSQGHPNGGRRLDGRWKTLTEAVIPSAVRNLALDSTSPADRITGLARTLPGGTLSCGAGAVALTWAVVVTVTVAVTAEEPVRLTDEGETVQ